MKAEFLKERYYKNKLYKVGAIVNMSLADFNAYEGFKVVKLFTPKTKKNKKTNAVNKTNVATEKATNNNKSETKSLEDLSYKELQELAEKNDIKKNIKKDDLIQALKDVGVHCKEVV